MPVKGGRQKKSEIEIWMPNFDLRYICTGLQGPELGRGFVQAQPELLLPLSQPQVSKHWYNGTMVSNEITAWICSWIYNCLSEFLAALLHELRFSLGSLFGIGWILSSCSQML